MILTLQAIIYCFLQPQRRAILKVSASAFISIMGKHNSIGAYGELMACQYLREHNYAILETNWRKGRHEADIIAYIEGVLVFVEVKTRADRQYGDPQSFVDRTKQRSYIFLANAYVMETGRDEEVRFDIIAITVNENGTDIEHIPNAFSAVGQRR